jgi:hypothetical protein
VHIVEEIRKIRGSITRRQAKSALSKDGGTPLLKKKQSMSGDASPVVVQSPIEDEDSLVSVKPRQRFNEVSWQGPGKSSGPPRALGAKTPEIRRDISRQMQKAELDQRQRFQRPHMAADDVDTAKATELALKELLKSVREAKYVPDNPYTAQ